VHERKICKTVTFEAKINYTYCRGVLNYYRHILAEILIQLIVHWLCRRVCWEITIGHLLITFAVLIDSWRIRQHCTATPVNWLLLLLGRVSSISVTAASRRALLQKWDDWWHCGRPRPHQLQTQWTTPTASLAAMYVFVVLFVSAALSQTPISGDRFQTNGIFDRFRIIT